MHGKLTPQQFDPSLPQDFLNRPYTDKELSSATFSRLSTKLIPSLTRIIVHKEASDVAKDNAVRLAESLGVFT